MKYIYDPEEFANLDDSVRVYQCQDCRYTSQDRDEFKYVVLMRIAFVFCKGCLK